MDTTWHSRPCGSATQAHLAPTRRDVTYIFIFIVIIWVIIHISIPYSESKLTCIFNASYISDMFLQFLSCGTKFHTDPKSQVTWPKEER